MAKIYIASKAKHAPKWIAARNAGVPIISTWVDEYMPGATTDWPGLWVRCVNEASNATALVLYQEEGEILKGALIETGIALASKVPVFYVGSCSAEQMSVLNHPLVTNGLSIEDAFIKAILRH